MIVFFRCLSFSSLCFSSFLSILRFSLTSSPGPSSFPSIPRLSFTSSSRPSSFPSNLRSRLLIPWDLPRFSLFLRSHLHLPWDLPHFLLFLGSHLLLPLPADILYPIELCSYLNSNFSFHISSTLLSNVVFFSAACTYDYSDAAPNNNTDTPSTRYAHKHTLKLPTPLHGTEHEEKQSYWLNS